MSFIYGVEIILSFHLLVKSTFSLKMLKLHGNKIYIQGETYDTDR